MLTFDWNIRQKRLLAVAFYVSSLIIVLLYCLGFKAPRVVLTNVLWETFVGFEPPAGNWSPLRLDETPSGRSFLGPFEPETVRLEIEDLPSHESIQISFDLLIIDSWDGNSDTEGPDRFKVVVDYKDIVFYASFLSSGPESTDKQSYPRTFGDAECPGQTGAIEVNSLGYIWRDSPQDSVYRITRSFAHTGSTILFQFVSPGTGPNVDDESWGIDNFSLTTSTGEAVEAELAWLVPASDGQPACVSSSG